MNIKTLLSSGWGCILAVALLGCSITNCLGDGEVTVEINKPAGIVTSGSDKYLFLTGTSFNGEFDCSASPKGTDSVYDWTFTGAVTANLSGSNSKVSNTIDLTGTATKSASVIVTTTMASKSGPTPCILTGSDSVTIVPVQIKQLNFPTSSDTTDLGTTQEKIISENEVAYITGAPEMPKLEVSVGSAFSGATVEWRMEVKTERSERDTKDDFKIPSTGTIAKPIGEAWKIYEQYSAPHDFFGGEVEVFYRIKKSDSSYLANEKQVKFKIRGKNPKDADAKAYIQSTSGVYRYAWAIVQHESRQGNRVYNQFNSGGSMKELPNFSGNYPTEDGWGMAQLDRPSGVSASTKEVYSWKENMSKSYAELNGKKSDAERFVKWIKNLWKNDSRWEEPPATFTVSSSAFTPIELATIVLYNGASGVPTSSGKDDNGVTRSFRSPLTFDPTKSAGHRWEFHDNTNPINHLHYATTVIKDEWEHNLPVSE